MEYLFYYDAGSNSFQHKGKSVPDSLLPGILKEKSEGNGHLVHLNNKEYKEIISYLEEKENPEKKVKGKKSDLEVKVTPENEHLTEFTSGAPKYLTHEIIINAVAEHYNLDRETLLNGGRRSDIARPRMVAMYLCRKLTDSSTPVIGRSFGKGHVTILSGCNRVEKMFEKDEIFYTDVTKLSKSIRKHYKKNFLIP